MIAALILGGLLVNLSAHAVHMSNCACIYTLDPAARNRNTTAYVFAYFCGGMLGSSLAASLYATHGWAGVSLLGLALALVAILAWVREHSRPLLAAVRDQRRLVAREQREPEPRGRPARRG
jgi:MFS family permease